MRKSWAQACASGRLSHTEISGHCSDSSSVGSITVPAAGRYGCGRKVNPGKHASGRAFDTCCPLCASGSHDALCGKEACVS